MDKYLTIGTLIVAALSVYILRIPAVSNSSAGIFYIGFISGVALSLSAVVAYFKIRESKFNFFR